jgi:hypothetical protein
MLFMSSNEIYFILYKTNLHILVGLDWYHVYIFLCASCWFYKKVKNKSNLM